jgi:mRNA interferase YafQ
MPRTIERRGIFKRDYKREIRGRYREEVECELPNIIETLAADKQLAKKLRDHPFHGNWRYFRECHVGPDLLLVYRKRRNGILELVRLGSHNEIFG